jgi:hypothetical protein
MMFWPHIAFYERQGYECNDWIAEREECSSYLGTNVDYLAERE